MRYAMSWKTWCGLDVHSPHANLCFKEFPGKNLIVSFFVYENYKGI